MHSLIFINDQMDFIPEITVMFQPTSPIRDIEKINNSIENVKSNNYNSSVSVYRSHYLFWSKSDNPKAKWTSNYGNNRPMRQQLEQYTEDGAIYVFNSLMFLKSANRIIHPVHIQENNQINSYEIDTPTIGLF